jgi:hypothetical protein
MTGKGRTGPRERQTMSGMLRDRHDATVASRSSGPDVSPSPVTTTAASVIVDPLSVDPQSLVQMSLWKRVFDAANRDFERDDTPTRLQDQQPQPNQRNRRDRDRDDDR